MRILIEQSGHALKNMGDWVMLQVAVKRCLHLFPGARIQVVAEDPARLQHCIAGVEPLQTAGREMMLGTGFLFGGRASFAGRLDRRLVLAAPSALLPLIRLRHRASRRNVEVFDAFVEAIHGADLVLTSGGGFITDAFPRMVEGVCGVLSIAQKLGKPTAMLGQGLGPLTKPGLLRRATAALRNLKLLTLRESRRSRDMAHQLGVHGDRIAVTGDDAIEYCHGNRSRSSGSQLGLNVRATPYSAVDSTDLSVIRDVVQELLRRFRAVPCPLPISFYDDEDVRSTELLLPPDLRSSNGQVARPEDVIRLAAGCRLVVTGSYHAGVFALAQGVPVIGLAKSEYYADKFLGLAEQFGEGCECVLLNHPHFAGTLLERASLLWERSDSIRQSLLLRAEDQIEKSRAAYRRIPELVH